MTIPRRSARAAAFLAGFLLFVSCGPKVPYAELRDEDPKVRMDAALRLGEEKPPDAVPALVAILDDPDEFVRIQAVVSLGKIGDEAAVPALARLAADPLSSVRLATIQALGKIGDEAAIPILSKSLYEEDETLRTAAAKALGEIPGDASLDALLSVAIHDEHERVREHVVRVIRMRRAREAVPRLEGMLSAESDHVRAHAVLTLGQLADRSSVPVLLRGLDDPYYKVRSLSAHALGTIAPDDPAAAAAIRERLAKEDTGLTRVDMAWSLVRFGDRSGIDTIRDLLFRGDPEDVRAEAARALGEIGDASDAARLEKALKDKKGLVRSEAFKALEKLKEAKN